MSARAFAFDPTRLDVESFAAEGGELEGRWPLTGFDRVCESAAPESPPTDADQVASWRARGERVARRGAEPETWLHLQADATVALTCQRCLAPVEVPLQVQRKFLFVHGENAAAEIDDASDDDVLAMTRALDLRELLEDELLLAMPLVPLHPVCALPLPAIDAGVEPEVRPNPFAALAALKRGD